MILLPEIADPNPSPTSEPGMVTKKMGNIPRKYRSPQTIPLKVTIVAGDNSADLEMAD